MSESRVEYEHADEWLYPNFAAWCEGNGKNPVAHNVFSRTAIEIATTTLGRGFVRKAISGNGAHIEGLRLRRDEELVRSHEELVRNSLPNSEVYSIENYELSKNEELLDISTDFPCSKADNSAASKSCEENQESFKESLGVPHVHNFQSVSPHEFLTSSSRVPHEFLMSPSQVRNSPPPGPDILPDTASASPAETTSATKACTDNEPDISSATPAPSIIEKRIVATLRPVPGGMSPDDLIRAIKNDKGSSPAMIQASIDHLLVSRVIGKVNGRLVAGGGAA